MSRELLPLAVRAYARRPRQADEKPPGSRPPGSDDDAAKRRPELLLVFDTETRTDLGQGLLFGCYRFYVLTWQPGGPDLACLEEGLLYADELEATDPEGFDILRAYVAGNLAATVREPVADLTPRPDLRLRSRADFVEQVFFRALVDGATVALFDAPFDLSRISVRWGEADAHGFEGGFSLVLFEKVRNDGETTEKAYRPRVLVNPPRLQARQARPQPGAPRQEAGHGRGTDPALLDLRTLAYVFTGESESLDRPARRLASTTKSARSSTASSSPST